MLRLTMHITAHLTLRNMLHWILVPEVPVILRMSVCGYLPRLENESGVTYEVMSVWPHRGIDVKREPSPLIRVEKVRIFPEKR